MQGVWQNNHEQAQLNLNLITQSIQQQDQLEQVEKKSLKTKRIMLVEDEDDIVLLFKMILESDVGLKVDHTLNLFLPWIISGLGNMT